MTRLAQGSGVGGRVLVIGAGLGGLSAAARLAHAGYAVTVLERHDAPGGKMRTLPSEAGPVDAGPTVLTLRPVLEELFAALDERLEDHVTLTRLHVIARHFWPDGSRLDLHDTAEANSAAIQTFAGARAARQFRDFSDRARRLFDMLDAPMMQSAAPSRLNLALHCLTDPRGMAAMAPLSSLAGLLTRSFDDPRLRQLFGRYATYVGGAPDRVPALLSLIWQVEAAGVWTVRGGMHRLARALETLATRRGATFHYDAHVARIEAGDGQVTGVTLQDGTRLDADVVLFNGDPRALATGALGHDAAHLAPATRTAPRSLSAEVWSFAARADGPELAHHNVFFRTDADAEFAALANGQLVPDPTLYICAMDRGGGPPTGAERFEIIANAPPLPAHVPEFASCHARTFQTLDRFGLRFDPPPGPDALTTPSGFETLFPASQGALYGQSPHGLMAAFRRPTARTTLRGLYLAGGGTHPGAGVPMAILSGRHAAATILTDRISTSPSRRTATRGGISTA